MTDLHAAFRKNLEAPRAALDEAASTKVLAEGETNDWPSDREMIRHSIAPEMRHWLERMAELSRGRDLTWFQLRVVWFRFRHFLQLISPVMIVAHLQIAGLRMLVASAHIWYWKWRIFLAIVTAAALAAVYLVVSFVVENLDALVEIIRQWISR